MVGPCKPRMISFLKILSAISSSLPALTFAKTARFCFPRICATIISNNWVAIIRGSWFDLRPSLLAIKHASESSIFPSESFRSRLSRRVVPVETRSTIRSAYPTVGAISRAPSARITLMGMLVPVLKNFPVNFGNLVATFNGRPKAS